MDNPKNTPADNRKWQSEKKASTINAFALVSLIIGILALVCFCFPPIQLIFGGLAIMFAVLSKQGIKFENMAVAGLLIGILSCVTSFMIFWQAMNTLNLLKQDPQYISYLNKMIKDLEQIFGVTN